MFSAEKRYVFHVLGRGKEYVYFLVGGGGGGGEGGTCRKGPLTCTKCFSYKGYALCNHGIKP